jgi:hypothetical protein
MNNRCASWEAQSANPKSHTATLHFLPACTPCTSKAIEERGKAFNAPFAQTSGSETLYDSERVWISSIDGIEPGTNPHRHWDAMRVIGMGPPPDSLAHCLLAKR